MTSVLSGPGCRLPDEYHSNAAWMAPVLASKQS